MTLSVLSLAHTPTTPSSSNQTAGPVPATPRCSPGQHPFTCLQPFPVPHIRARHDGHPWPTYCVCIPGLGLVIGSSQKLCGICIITLVLSSRSPVVCSRKRRFEEDERQSIPNVLQGEVARLDPKFLVNLDPSHCSNNGAVHLICKLGECPGGVCVVVCHPCSGQSPGLQATHVLTRPATLQL